MHISNSFDLLHFISFEIMFRCPSVHIHLIFPEKFQGDFDKSFGIIQNALNPQSRHGFCDVLDSIRCWLSVCCVDVISLISTICWFDLGFINNYKKFQLWLILLRYNTNVANFFLWEMVLDFLIRLRLDRWWNWWHYK